jgi:DNA-binding NarL/FixJ family response regulator
VIVDDEPLARQALRRLLAAHADVEIAGEAESLAGAIDAVGRTRPQLVFLDIELGGGVARASTCSPRWSIRRSWYSSPPIRSMRRTPSPSRRRTTC